MAFASSSRAGVHSIEQTVVAAAVLVLLLFSVAAVGVPAGVGGTIAVATVVWRSYETHKFMTM